MRRLGQDSRKQMPGCSGMWTGTLPTPDQGEFWLAGGNAPVLTASDMFEQLFGFRRTRVAIAGAKQELRE